jgi:type IV pilus assembly protein PilN
LIRVNLLPQKRRPGRAERAASESQAWLIVVLGVLLLEIVGLLFFHGMKHDELDRQLKRNAERTVQIDQLKKAVLKHDEVKARLAELRAREEAISKLQGARTGPTAMLLELARSLTPGRGPSVEPATLAQLRRDNPLSVYNETWDARRLWLLEFREEARKIQLKGIARDGEDVSELARRMELSSYFHDVRLLPAKKERLPNGMELVNFELEAKVKY